ncbi:DUF3322 domain-containing protein [Corynebacterium glyciniphilum]|uniref:DUF3322 domain-containing protein n=1 Tax=Corynebacterium glyciniphilum TaxID=1404244 RepID=UPI0026517777|nr:DUF3322 domain-containing protein [Corynebacterium glyciniphilum]MDN5684879.1 DUF3322 domain-containing protein [Corynebacterium glyciniphilum]MDN6706658.1 DUF3322 domain-containing protein [Corynebacterium glyciniphilum]
MARTRGSLTPQDAMASLSATVQRRWKTWLVSPDEQNSVDLPLHPPTGKATAQDVTAASAWVRSWQNWEKTHPQARVVWVEKSWTAAGLGRQLLPDRLQVAGVDALVSLTGTTRYWRGLVRRFAALAGASPAPAVREAAAAVLPRWRDLDDADLSRVHAVVDWFLAHPSSGLMPRAVPVEGVHGKWLESHRTLVTRLVAAHRGDTSGKTVATLTDLGLVEREAQVRLRLPEGLPGWAGVPGDVTLTWSGAAGLWAEELTGSAPPPVTGVLLVENLETFLALPASPGRMLLWGAGYSARRWATLPWLADLPVWYWGDLDADGFAILSAVRSHLPQVQSVLMDEAAVRRWLQLGTVDSNPDRKNLSALTASEDAARDLLASSGNLRIEQERILLSEAVDALTGAGFYEED